MSAIVKHKRSNKNNSKPNTETLEYGEIAIRYKTDEECFFIKNDSDDIIAIHANLSKTEINEMFSKKQGLLVSGTNIKTINGESLLGGDDLKVGHKQLVTTTATKVEMSPNIYYRKTNQTATLTLTLITENDSTILNEYLIEFTTASGGTTISLPSSIKWANGEVPVFEANTTYQISIVNNLGVCTKFS
jgi:hypothetical protein